MTEITGLVDKHGFIGKCQDCETVVYVPPQTYNFRKELEKEIKKEKRLKNRM
jgi:hypothetical protein